MFADDTLLFGRTTIQEAQVFKSILHTYEHWSGHLVSVQKSAIQFSPNMDEGTREAISEILGMPEIISHGTYLGPPTTIGASKKAIFNSIIDRVKAKVVDWKPRLLSKAGKEVFINIGGGQEDTKKAMHWASWDKLCKAKSVGGLCFRDLRTFNQALLSKQV
ncbi:hypothetical protein LIER_18815 [Lithospermum erythrorhizon]|uniref:Reverse transcriptase domain-containing protein n=1 Tax=Lithospermum erythrorhizon TaxID=34254 RepID=A0AAV3QJT0_LITER